MTKKTLFHIERDTTRAGRTINALLGLLTANRYALIFSLKLTLVKRNYQPERMRQRALENLYIALVLFPVTMGIVLGMRQCKPIHPAEITPSDTIQTPPTTHQFMKPLQVANPLPASVLL